MKRKSIIVIALMLAMLTACTCGCNCGESKAGGSNTAEIKYVTVKYVSKYVDTYVGDLMHDDTHYRSFTLPNGGTFVVNVTLDSLQQELLERQLERM
jgi:hypothetical protein